MIGQRVVITGASSGIGRACALRLAADGWTVYAGVLTAGEADDASRAGSGRLRPVILDVTDAESIRAAAELVARETGSSGISGLVNNAGIAIAAPLELIPIHELRRQFEVNVIGPVAVTQALLPLLRGGSGRIVNIGSAFGSVAIPFLAPYTAAKAALERVTDTLRMELVPWNIPVSLITPSRVGTPIWSTSLAAAVKIARGISSDRRKLYDWPDAIASLGDSGRSLKEIPVAAVVAAVVHALTARRPRRSYPVSASGRLVRTVPHLGGGALRDWVGLRATGFRPARPGR